MSIFPHFHSFLLSLPEAQKLKKKQEKKKKKKNENSGVDKDGESMYAHIYCPQRNRRARSKLLLAPLLVGGTVCNRACLCGDQGEMNVEDCSDSITCVVCKKRFGRGKFFRCEHNPRGPQNNAHSILCGLCGSE